MRESVNDNHQYNLLIVVLTVAPAIYVGVSVWSGIRANFVAGQLPVDDTNDDIV